MRVWARVAKFVTKAKPHVYPIIALFAALAATEGLDLDARTSKPTRAAIYAKLYLLRVGGETWSAVGSLNGGEVSHKLNRGVLLLVDAPAVHAHLAKVYTWDWARS